MLLSNKPNLTVLFGSNCGDTGLVLNKDVRLTSSRWCIGVIDGLLNLLNAYFNWELIIRES